MLSGHLHIEMGDGSTMDCVAGGSYDIPPGHDGWVVGEVPWVAIDTEAHRLFAALEERGISLERAPTREGP